jgi:hypothetical protein
MAGDAEGPRLINPFDLLNAHSITASASTPRHDCLCGARFVIDPFAARPYEHSAGHIRDIMVAAAHSAQAFLAQVENRGIELPDNIRDLMTAVATDSD